jgi:prophage regulatory protein
VTHQPHLIQHPLQRDSPVTAKFHEWVFVAPVSARMVWVEWGVSRKRKEGCVLNHNRFLTFKQVRDLTGLSRSTIWRLERAGKFPRHHRISPNRVAWDQEAISRWMELTIQNIDPQDDSMSRKEQSDESDGY